MSSKTSGWCRWGGLCLLALLAGIWSYPHPGVQGQDKKPARKSSKGGKKPAANTKGLDAKADQLQTSFTKEAEDLAGQYYEAGHFEKAKSLLEAVLVVNPEAPNVQQKLQKVKEGLLSSNDFEIDVNPSHGWKPAGVMVIENRPFRIKAEGTYRFEASASGISAAGWPSKDPAEDLVAGMPCGALMGFIAAEGKETKPFLIGESLEYTPKEEGMLLLRINTPPGNKSSGKIRVTISGNVESVK